MPDADSAEVIVLLENGGGAVYAAADCDIEPVETIDATRRFARVRAKRRRAAGLRSRARRSTASPPPRPPSWWAWRSG